MQDGSPRLCIPLRHSSKQNYPRDRCGFPFISFPLLVLMNVLSEYEAFPELYTERERSIEEEERNARLDTPLFVCQLSFPGVPTNLHFFEPR